MTSSDAVAILGAAVTFVRRLPARLRELRPRAPAWALAPFLAVALACPSDPESGPPPRATPQPVVGTSTVAAASAPRPRLVVLLIVDQMRADYLDRFRPLWSDGFVRLLDGGAVWTNLHHDHAITFTAAGHATLTTGVHPGRHGVISNSYLDRESWIEVPISVDPEARVVGAETGTAQSARLLRRSAVGDWLHDASPASKVFVFALKDRAAISAGGQRPDGLFWQDPIAERFVSSSRYVDALPGWLAAINASFDPAPLLEHGWTRTLDESRYAAFGPDAVAQEADGVHTSFPHLPGDLLALDAGSPDRALRWTPFGDVVTFDLAEAFVREESLGKDEAPDLLIVSLSAPDYVGHRYGPDSHEMADEYVRIDRQLGDFLRGLDREIGEGGWTLVLTSDHGAMSLPESVGGGKRWLPVDTDALVAAALVRARVAAPEVTVLDAKWLDGVWLRFADEVAVGDREHFLAAMARAIEEDPAVVRAFTRGELRAPDPKDALALGFAHSYDGERSADILVHFGPNQLVTEEARGTSHGTAYEHDTHVPLIAYGVAVTPARHDEPARTVDVAPTLAALLGVPTPDDLDGAALDLARSDAQEAPARRTAQ